MDDVWGERDTTPARIEAALRELVKRRHLSEQAFVPARVLNLVVVADREFRGEVENRLEKVRESHPSRLVLCAVEPGRRTLDAVAQMATPDTSRPGALAVGRERVELRLGTKHLPKLDTIVDPLLMSDLATMVWSPHGHPEAVDALSRLAQIALIDSHDEPAVGRGLNRAASLSERVYVVDLAWLRSAPWRERLAAAFDPPPLRGMLGQISKVTVRHREDSVAAAVLLCGWLASRLGWRPEGLMSDRSGLRGHARARRHEVAVALEPMQMNAPGLDGVAIETASGTAVSLDRAPGGLRSMRRARDGREEHWTVLGASRGESGILGEGVRQALLRDPTYRPALAAAQAMVA